MPKPPVLQVRSGVIRGSESRSVRGGKLPPVRRTSPTSAHATIGRILMALLEVLDMTDPDRVQRIMLELVPPSLATSEIPALCAALRSAGAAALADHIHAAFDMGALE